MKIGRFKSSALGSICLSIGLAMVNLATAQAASDPWQLSVGGLYSKGYDDELDRASTWHVPVALKYSHPRWAVQIVSSYLRADGLGADDAYSGLGDTQLKATYLVKSPLFKHWWLDVSGKIKLPTADEVGGLGTGEIDYWLDLEAMRAFSRGWFGHVGGGKKYRGDRDDWALLDSYYFNAGTGKRWAGRHTTGLQLKHMQASTQRGEEMIEVMPYSGYRLTAQSSLLLYLLKGFTDSSGDYGVGFQFSYRFAAL